MKWIGFLFHHAPFSLPSFFTQEFLTFLFKTPIEEGRLDFWEGRVIGIRVQDLGIHLDFTKNKACILKVKKTLPEVCISGDLKTFLLLAARRADPDTLFFQRKLLIEGDTALGLEIKNFLDSLEIESLPAPLRQAHHILVWAGLIK